MNDLLTIIKIIPNQNGIQLTLQNNKICEIALHRRVLIRHKTVKPNELKIGNEILTYGFDIDSNSVYNKSRYKKNHT